MAKINGDNKHLLAPAAGEKPAAPSTKGGLISPFSSESAFEAAQRMARCLSASDMVPEGYRGQRGLANCMVALELAARLKTSVFMVMQNVYVIHGRPAFNSQFIIAAVNSCGRFFSLRFEEDDKDGGRCRAWAIEKASGDRLEGPWVSMKLAEEEGWTNPRGTKNVMISKWKTMPEAMLKYRAASFFGRLYAPDVMMGMYSDDEVESTQQQKEQITAEIVTEAKETAEGPMPEIPPARDRGQDIDDLLDAEAEPYSLNLEDLE